jgi:hypothetical protein
MERRRYTTEIRGDGATRMWTLHHRLRHPSPAVTLRDAAGKNVSWQADCTYPSASEVTITFAHAPPAGRIHRVEVTASDMGDG